MGSWFQMKGVDSRTVLRCVDDSVPVAYDRRHPRRHVVHLLDARRDSGDRLDVREHDAHLGRLKGHSGKAGPVTTSRVGPTPPRPPGIAPSGAEWPGKRTSTIRSQRCSTTGGWTSCSSGTFTFAAPCSRTDHTGTTTGFLWRLGTRRVRNQTRTVICLRAW